MHLVIDHGMHMLMQINLLSACVSSSHESKFQTECFQILGTKCLNATNVTVKGGIVRKEDLCKCLELFSHPY